MKVRERAIVSQTTLELAHTDTHTHTHTYTHTHTHTHGPQKQKTAVEKTDRLETVLKKVGFKSGFE